MTAHISAHRALRVTVGSFALTGALVAVLPIVAPATAAADPGLICPGPGPCPGPGVGAPGLGVLPGPGLGEPGPGIIPDPFYFLDPLL